MMIYNAYGVDDGKIESYVAVSVRVIIRYNTQQFGVIRFFFFVCYVHGINVNRTPTIGCMMIYNLLLFAGF